MNLSPSETQALVQKTARDYAERVIMPRAAAIDALRGDPARDPAGPRRTSG